MCFNFPGWVPPGTRIGDPVLLPHSILPQPPVPGWVCKGCGACWSPYVPGCWRCNSRGNRAANPLVDIVISPPAADDAR